MVSSALPPSGGVAPRPRRPTGPRPSRAIRLWALVAAAVASLVAWGLVGLSSLAAGQALPPTTPGVDEDVNPGPCAVFVLIQCLCTDPRVYIVRWTTLPVLLVSFLWQLGTCYSWLVCFFPADARHLSGVFELALTGCISCWCVFSSRAFFRLLCIVTAPLISFPYRMAYP